jgi:DNA-binding transcriptional LysR family regulator
LVNHVFVGYIEELLQLDVVRWLEELVSKPRLVFTSNSMIAQMSAAAGGGGIVVLPTFAVRADLADLVRILPQLQGRRDLWLSSHPDMQGVARIRTLRQFLEDLVARDADAFVTAQAGPAR